MAKLKRLMTTSIGEHVEGPELTYTAWENLHCYSHCANPFGSQYLLMANVYIPVIDTLLAEMTTHTREKKCN